MDEFLQFIFHRSAEEKTGLCIKSKKGQLSLTLDTY